MVIAMRVVVNTENGPVPVEQLGPDGMHRLQEGIAEVWRQLCDAANLGSLPDRSKTGGQKVHKQKRRRESRDASANEE